MARHATIIGHTHDIDGHPYDVRERRAGPDGLVIEIGWPEGHRGKGCGGPKIILTPALAAWLEEHRRTPNIVDRLPFGGTALKRLRSLLGHNRYSDAGAWWRDHIDELASMTYAEFSARHGVVEAIACLWARRLLGARLRPAGWWRSEEARSILLADEPTVLIADKLGIALSSVRRLRSAIRQETGEGA